MVLTPRPAVWCSSSSLAPCCLWELGQFSVSGRTVRSSTSTGLSSLPALGSFLPHLLSTTSRGRSLALFSVRHSFTLTDMVVFDIATAEYVIRRRHFAWWTKYNYVLSAALDSGTAISTIFIFFTLQYPKAGTIGSTNVAVWWGNTVYENTADYNGTSLNVLPVNGTFGPGTW
jgi:hypothetical protein